MVNQALKSAEILAQQGVEASVISLKTIAPLPVEALREALAEIRHLIIAEESFSEAGIHDALARRLQEMGEAYRIDYIDLGSQYVPHGDMASLYKHYGLDGQSIADHILEVRKIEN
jgi:1-deoxy-D-xylulose-5-phosphate synthase